MAEVEINVLGLGGPIGDGSQAISWVHIDDLIDAYLFALKKTSMQGVFHIAAPKPVTNLEFTKTMGAVLHRPTLFRVPHSLLKLLFGEGANVMTSGQWVVSKRLPDKGFKFRYADLDQTIDVLKIGNNYVTATQRFPFTARTAWPTGTTCWRSCSWSIEQRR